MYSIPINVARLGVVPAGRLITVTVADPAAGADWAKIITTAYAVQLLGIRFRLSTGAAVPARGLDLVTYDGVSERQFVNVTATQALSLVQDWFFMPGALAESLLTTKQVVPMAPLWLLPGWQISSQSSNLDALDQYSDIKLLGVAYPLDVN